MTEHTRPLPGPPRPGSPVVAPPAAGPAAPVPTDPSAAPPQVAAALARLDGVDQLPVTEHVAVYDEVHRLLQDALASLDER